jgi:hypothetical protein
LMSSEHNGTQEADPMEPWLAEIIDSRRGLLTAGAGRVDAKGLYPAGQRLPRQGGRP